MDPFADTPAMFVWVIYLSVGLCMGSFASAIAHRISIGESWIVQRRDDHAIPARSACPSCGHVLSKFDLIPLFSWVLLGGKCRYCHAPIPVRYPLIELMGAVMMGIFTLFFSQFFLIGAFALTLPFCLAFILLWYQKAKVPIYVYGLLFSNIFIWVLAISYEQGSL